MSGNGWLGKHRKELLTAAAIGAGVAAPMILPGLLGGGAAAAAGGEAAGGLAGGLGAGAADEVTAGYLTSQLPAGNPMSVALGNFGTQYGPTLGRVGKAAGYAQLLGGGQPPAPPSGLLAPLPQGQMQAPESASAIMQPNYSSPVESEEEKRRRRFAALLGGNYASL